MLSVLEGLRLALILKLTLITFSVTLTAYVLSDALSLWRGASAITESLGRLMSRVSIPAKASIALLLAPLGGRGMHSYLATLYRRGEVRDEHVLTFTLITSPITSLNLLLRFSFPVALASLGFWGALTYLGLAVIPSLIRSIAGVVYGLRIKGGGGEGGEGVSKQLRPCLRKSVKKGLSLSLKIAARFAAVFIVVNALSYLGLFNAFSTYLRPYVSMIGLSPAASVIIITSVFKPSIALMAAGALISNGSLHLPDALTALVIGRLAYLAITESSRAIIPFYSAMYRVKLALKVLAALLATQAASLPLQIAIIKLMTC